MKDSHALGNTKPPLVLRIEKAIMEMLFSIATGETRVKAAVRDLAVGLPWTEINGLGNNDNINNWFISRMFEICCV